jgi:hypothetical protein
MNIEALAREAGFTLYEHDGSDPQDCKPELARFAALVRDQAMEEAARLIDHTWHKTPAEYADAIRALVKPPA